MKIAVQTTRYWRGKLPHWEVSNGRYFVTVRCADSLPTHVVARLAEIHDTTRGVEPHSAEYAKSQRRYFATMEKYLEQGRGACPLRHAAAAELLVGELAALGDWSVSVPHYTIMPNHWHALVVPHPECRHSLGEILRRLKGRSARAINSNLGKNGPLWQREWFDRWMRDDAEFARCVEYIQNNPVKAGLVERPADHPWTL